MIIRTNLGVVYNGPDDLKVGDKIRARYGSGPTIQIVTEVNPEVHSYAGPIYAVGSIVERAAAGIDVALDGRNYTYHDLAGEGDDTTLDVRFYGDGAPTFYTEGDDYVILKQDQVQHLIKTLQEHR